MPNKTYTRHYPPKSKNKSKQFQSVFSNNKTDFQIAKETKIFYKNQCRLDFKDIVSQLDLNKIQVGIFLKNIRSHYSGGRYWSWLLGHILASDPNVQVTFVTNMAPPFGKSFELYNNNNINIYVDELMSLGMYINYNIFDVVCGIPTEGGIFAEVYGRKWKIPNYLFLFESPNFIRDYRNGSDGTEQYWKSYKDSIPKATGLINNTEIGRDYADKWVKENYPDFDSKKSNVLWNTINTRVADKVFQKEIIDSSNKHFHICYVGRAVQHKNVPHIIHALKTLKKYRFTFHIISGAAGGLVGRLSGLKGNNTTIQFYPKVDDYEKFKIIKMSNLMVFASSFEGFGLPPMEAAYCEKVCVCYDIPVLRLIYKDSVVFTPKNNVAELAKNIEKYLPDTEMKRQFIKNSKEYINKIASHQLLIENFFNIVGGKKKNTDLVDKSKITKILNENKRPGKVHNAVFSKVSVKQVKRRLTFGMIVCNADQFVYHTLRHIYDIADEIIIVEGAVKIFSEIIDSYTSTDDTLKQIVKFSHNHDTLKRKIKLFTSKDLKRPWESKIKMQNVIAENTTGTIYVKQDADEYYDLEGLMREIIRLENKANCIVVRYNSHHFWGDSNHVITGKNFNTKQARIWKWRPSFRHLKSINFVTDVKTNKHINCNAFNSIISRAYLWHYNYIYNHKSRAAILEYYKRRPWSGENQSITKAWLERNPELLDPGYVVKSFTLSHPLPKNIITSFQK